MGFVCNNITVNKMAFTIYPAKIEIYDELNSVSAVVTAHDEATADVYIKTAVTDESWKELCEAITQAIAMLNLEK